MENNLTKNFHSTLILSIVLVALIAICIILPFTSVKTARDAFDDAKEDAHDKAKDYVSTKTEEYYHVSNDAYASIDSIKNEGKIEVLKVSDVVFINDAESEDDEAKVWLQVDGEGVFRVDLSRSEVIIDETNKIIKVRVPQPELTTGATSFTKLQYKEGLSDRLSIKKGTDLALKHQDEGIKQIDKDIRNNQQYNEMAKQLATELIQESIIGLNSEFKNLTIEVEFVDW